MILSIELLQSWTLLTGEFMSEKHDSGVNFSLRFITFSKLVFFVANSSLSLLLVKGKLRFAKKKKIYYLNSKSGVRNDLKIQEKTFLSHFFPVK